MGKRKRLHREAVIDGKEPPFRASPDKTKLFEAEMGKALGEIFEAVSKLAGIPRRK